MSWFQKDDAAIFYTDQGHGDTVLLLHGWSCDSQDWSWQIPALNNAGYRTIAVDHRGHGRSTAPYSDYRPETLADDAAALLEHLAAGPVIVLGHSMGTVVASALAVRHPEQVAALVLVDPVYMHTEDRISRVMAVVSGPNPRQAAADMFLARFYTSQTPDWLKTWHFRRVLGTPEHVVKGCIMGLYGAEDGIGRISNSRGYLKNRRAPRLVFVTSEAAVDFEREVGMSEMDKVRLLSNAGHFLHQELSDAINQDILSWLAQLRPELLKDLMNSHVRSQQ